MKRKRIIIASILIVVWLALASIALILGNKDIISLQSIKRALMEPEDTGHSFTVYYLEKETHMTINPAKVDTTHNPGDVIEADEQEITISGFEYDSADVDSIVMSENPEDNVINLYYTRKPSKVIVHHYLKGEDFPLVSDEEITGYVTDYYETFPSEEAMTENNVRCINTPSNQRGTFSDYDTEVTFYYEPNEGEVNVLYLEDGNEANAVNPLDNFTGEVNTTYRTSPKEIEGYECVGSTDNTEGCFTTETINVKYYYKQKSAVIINYIDKDKYDEMIAADPDLQSDVVIPDECKLEETKRVEGVIGTNYQSKPLNIEGYDLVTRPPEENVTFASNYQTLNYEYTKRTSGILEKHVDIINGTLLDCDYNDGNVGDPYECYSKTFDGYSVVSNQQYKDKTGNTLPDTVTDMSADYIPSNSIDVLSDSLTEVVFYYIRTAKIEVKYVEKTTGMELYEDSSQISFEQDGTWTIDGSTEASYSMMVPEGYDYTTELKDLGLFAPAKNKDMYTDAEIEEKGINPDDDYIPERANGTARVSNDGNNVEVITYYYVVQSAGVTVEHIDIYTGKTIETEDLITGNNGDPYGTDYANLEGYRPVTNAEYCRFNNIEIPVDTDFDTYYRPNDATGKMGIGQKFVKYYYIRPIKIIAQYIDILTDEEIPSYLEEFWYENNFGVPNMNDGFSSRVIIDGVEGDEYSLKAKKFENYEDVFVEPQGASGVMMPAIKDDGTLSNEVYIPFFYARYSGGVTVVHYNLDKDEVIEYVYLYDGVGLPYTAEPLDDENYVLAKNSDVYTEEQLAELGLNPNDEYRPSNETGLYQTEDQLVQYYYKEATEDEPITTGKVITKYVDFDKEEDNVLKTLESKGDIGTEYKTDALEFVGYELIKNKDFYTEEELETLGLDPEDDYIPENYKGEYQNGEIEVVYYYREITTIPDEPTEDPRIPQIKMTPASISVVAKGASQEYRLDWKEFEQDGCKNYKVEWELDGKTSENTKIEKVTTGKDANGNNYETVRVYIAPDEEAETIRLVARYVADLDGEGDVSGEIVNVITVEPKETPDNPDEPGTDDPDGPGKDDPKEDPDGPGKDDPKEDPDKPGKEDPKEDPDRPGKEDSDKTGKGGDTITNNYNTTNNYYNTVNNNYTTDSIVPAPAGTVVVGTTGTAGTTGATPTVTDGTTGSKVTVTDGSTTGSSGTTGSSSSGSNSTAKTPSTGDMLPVIAVGGIVAVLIANIATLFIKKNKKEE